MAVTDGDPKWTVQWLKERVQNQHHAVLTKYLMHRSWEQAKQADAAGLPLNEILRQAFDPKNGNTAVPQDAMKVLRNVDGVDPAVVIGIVTQSEDRRQWVELAKQFDRLVRAGKLAMSQDIRQFLDLQTVREVMES